MKIKLTETQYKKVVLREFGETVTDPKEWYLQILSWVESPNDLSFESNGYEVVVFDKEGVYLGYYDKEQEFGFVVNEYGVDSITKDELIDEQDGESTSTTSSDNQVSPQRGPANTLGNVPEVSPSRGPSNTLDNSPWSVSPQRGPANEIS